MAGRTIELENFEILLDRLEDGRAARSQIYSGLRGVCKTVLLSEFDARARGKGWVTTHVYEVPQHSDPRSGVARLAARILRAMRLKKRWKDRTVQGLRVVQSFIATSKGQKFDLGVAPVSGVADSGDIEDLSELVVELGEIAEAGGTGVLFVLDEMQDLDQETLGAICQALHKAAQRNLPITLVGMGLPTLPRLLLEARPYASRPFDTGQLGRLTESAAARALREPALLEGVRFEDSAVAAIVEACEGYPYFVQEYGRVLWNEIEDPLVRAEDVADVSRLVEDSLATKFFSPHFDMATDSEQDYLLAMAAQGDGPYSSSSISNQLGLMKPGHASKMRKGLLDKELIWVPRRGQFDFTLPRFEHYLRTEHGD